MKAGEFNRMERLRDPSHTNILSFAELRAMFSEAGLPGPRLTTYRLDMDLDALLRRCCPEPGDVDVIHEIFDAALVDDRLGIPVRREGSRIHVSYPIAVLAAKRMA